MGPPMTWEEVVGKYQDDFQVALSFGLEQGTDESGAPKFRRIDDHSASPFCASFAKKSHV